MPHTCLSLHRLLATLVLALLASVAAADPNTLYDQLREPEAGAAFRIEHATVERPALTFELGPGRVVPLLAGDRPIGAVYEGEARLVFTPPDGVEQQQLERFSGSPVLKQDFRRLLLLGSNGYLDELRAAATGERGDRETRRALRYARKRLEHHLDKRRRNLAARLLLELREGRSDWLLAEPDTREHGVLSYEHDPLEPEPVSLSRWSDRYSGGLDTWCSFALADAPVEPRASVSDYAIELRLDGDEIEQLRVDARLETGTPDVRVLLFELHPLMEVASVHLGEGSELPWFREKVDRKSWETALAVELPAPLSTGQQLRFELKGDIIEDLHGGRYGLSATTGWYPRLHRLQRARYRLELDCEESHRAFASARLVDERVEDGRRLSSWEQDFPVAAVAFSYGDMPVEHVEAEGAPPITVFGREEGLVRGNQLRTVGRDVADAMIFFTRLYGPVPFQQLYVSWIPFLHGQGFPGLLQLSKLSFGGDIRGASEAFRAHEVAHQWWGHAVGWQSYRDQWLSEGLAEYSGALYMLHATDDQDLFDRMLEAWTNDILGRGSVRASLGMARFGRSRSLSRHGDGTRAGPLSLGRRLLSSEGPADYSVLVYEKGAYVAHMLRMLSYDWEHQSDDVFRSIMHDFATSQRGLRPSSADFQATVERHLDQDMHWFFEQWVHGTAVPRYHWAWQAQPADDGWTLRVRVRQELREDHGARPGQSFRMPVPVAIELADGSQSVRRLQVEREQEVFELSLPVEPVDVQLNPRRAVLCETDEESF